MAKLSDAFQVFTNTLPSGDKLNTLFKAAASDTTTSIISKTADITYEIFRRLPEDVKSTALNTIGGVQKASGMMAAVYRTLTIPPPPESFDINKRLPTPTGWQEDIIKSDGRDIKYTLIKTPNAVGTIIFPMGHGTEAAYYKPWVSRKNRMGFNVITIQLPTAENNEFFADGTPIEDGYQRAIKDSLMDKNSPIYNHVPDHHALLLLTHSAGGASVEKCLFDDDNNAKFIFEKFGDNNIFHTGIMLDTAHSSQRFHPTLSKMYDWYSTSEYPRIQRLGTTEADRYWLQHGLKINDDAYMHGIQRNPTHGVANALKHSGIQHVARVEACEDLEKSHPYFAKLKRKILIGADEPSADPKTAEYYAGLIPGIEIRTFEDTKHNPIMECKYAYRELRKRAKQLAAEKVLEHTLH